MSCDMVGVRSKNDIYYNTSRQTTRTKAVKRVLPCTPRPSILASTRQATPTTRVLVDSLL